MDNTKAPDLDASLDKLGESIQDRMAELTRQREALAAIQFTVDVTKGLMAAPDVKAAPTAMRIELLEQALDECHKLARVGLGTLSEEEYSADKDQALTDSVVAAALERERRG